MELAILAWLSKFKFAFSKLGKSLHHPMNYEVVSTLPIEL